MLVDGELIVNEELKNCNGYCKKLIVSMKDHTNIYNKAYDNKSNSCYIRLTAWGKNQHPLFHNVKLKVYIEDEDDLVVKIYKTFIPIDYLPDADFDAITS